jgi:glycosyltransferase 2 family protein
MNDRVKRILWLVARLALMAGLVFYVLSKVDFHDTVRLSADGKPLQVLRDTQLGPIVWDPGGPEPGERLVLNQQFGPDGAVRVQGILSIGRRLGHAWWFVLAAFGVMMLQTPVGAIRWRLLLEVQGIHISLWESIRLTYIGWFFNNWLPGSTGGDFVKAYYIAKQTHHKAEAVTTVFLDRLIGLVAMCMLGAAAVIASYHDEHVRIARYFLSAFLLAVGGGALVFYSHRLRALFRLRYIKRLLPMQGTLDRVDGALFIYRYHKKAVILSVLYSWLTQVVSVLAVWWLAVGLGSHAPWSSYFINMPMVWICWSLIPLPAGGFGVAETLAQYLFGAAVLGVPAGEAATVALAMILAYRLVQWVVSAPGGVLYLMRRSHISTHQMRDEMAKAEGPEE